MTDKLPEDQKLALASQIPMARLGTVEEVAEAVLFLAGDSGSYITAQTLHINGGMYTVWYFVEVFLYFFSKRKNCLKNTTKTESIKPKKNPRKILENFCLETWYEIISSLYELGLVVITLIPS